MEKGEYRLPQRRGAERLGKGYALRKCSDLRERAPLKFRVWGFKGG